MKDFLRKLIQTDTTAEKGELAAAEVIAAELDMSGIDSYIDSWSQTKANIITHVKICPIQAGTIICLPS